MSKDLHAVTDSSFETDVIQNQTPVVVDFWATWCQPCKMLTPILEEAAADFAGKLKILKMNIEENTQTPAKYGVLAIPTLMVFKGGKMVGTKSGLMSKNRLS